MPPAGLHKHPRGAPLDSAKRSFLKFTPEDSSDPNRMIFVTDGSQVEEIYAGREPAVDAPEGCV